MEERFFKFSNLSCYPEVIHGISNRNFGDMRFGRITDEEVIKNRQYFFSALGIDDSEVVIPALVHSVKIAIVGQKEKGKGMTNRQSAIPATDGLITSDKRIYLMVTIADCLPIFLYDPYQNIVGVLHAGWRGIVQKIIPEAVEKLKNLGSEPQNLIVAVGPGICQKHFVVREDVLSLFKESHPSATFIRNNHGYVDLKKAAFLDLVREGVPKNSIEIAHICPSCDNGIYGSFRREKDTAPAAAAVIGIR